MTRLCQHIMSSQTFYPVHPPADDLPLDYILWSQRAQLRTAPHCLICPSRLRQFVKVCKRKCLCMFPASDRLFFELN